MASLSPARLRASLQLRGEGIFGACEAHRSLCSTYFLVSRKRTSSYKAAVGSRNLGSFTGCSTGGQRSAALRPGKVLNCGTVRREAAGRGGEHQLRARVNRLPLPQRREEMLGVSPHSLQQSAGSLVTRKLAMAILVRPQLNVTDSS